jgi:dTDP-4-dehydrorhamnose 3,5-epimerase
MPFDFEMLPIDGPVLIKPAVFNDNRGYFLETYKKSDFEAFSIKDNFLQDNLSYSKKNTVRGLHYQMPPYAQAKIVRVIKGRVLDVAVDVRRESPAFGKYFSVELSGENNLALYIPQGFAHGFSVLSDEGAFVFYKCTNEYYPGAAAGIRYDDKSLNIDWKVKTPVLSCSDLKLPYIESAQLFD